jgi:DNA-binding MarR family transcriptional regulator
MSETRWLDAAQQRDWRAYIEGSMRLHDLIEQSLKSTHGLSGAEYEILVQLSEAEGRRLRMAELAECAIQSRSRLSHTCGRLERKGLVRRETCPDDKRGVFCRLTDEGFAALDSAARDHVATVRELFIDVVEPADLEAVGRAFTAISQQVRAVRYR